MFHLRYTKKMLRMIENKMNGKFIHSHLGTCISQPTQSNVILQFQYFWVYYLKLDFHVLLFILHNKHLLNDFIWRSNMCLNNYSTVNKCNSTLLILCRHVFYIIDKSSPKYILLAYFNYNDRLSQFNLL